jgi:hypothetical protein
VMRLPCPSLQYARILQACLPRARVPERHVRRSFNRRKPRAHPARRRTTGPRAIGLRVQERGFETLSAGRRGATTNAAPSASRQSPPLRTALARLFGARGRAPPGPARASAWTTPRGPACPGPSPFTCSSPHRRSDWRPWSRTRPFPPGSANPAAATYRLPP